MAVKTRSELEDAADEIRDETGEGANTATRVGGALRDVVDSFLLAVEAGAGAPTSVEYLVGALSGGLSAERLITDTATIVWDLATGGVVRANVPDGSLARAKLAHASDLSVLGRAAAGSGALQDIPANTNDRIFARVSNVLGFFQVTRNMIQSGELITAHYELDSVTNAVLRDSGACSVIGRSANSSGDPADISAATNDRVFCRTGDTLQFAQISTGMIADLAVTTAKLAGSAVDNTRLALMAEGTIKGRAAAGTGTAQDLTATQVRAVINMVLSQVLAGGATTGANNLGISAAQVLELIAGTPSTAGPANALIEFKREGGGTSSFIGIRTAGGLRYEGQDGVTIVGVASGAHVVIGAGSAASVLLQSGSAGTTVNSTGLVTVQDVRCIQYDTLSNQGNTGTAKTVDWNFGTNNMPSALQSVTLTGNCTFTFTNPEMPAYPLMLELHQDATGGRSTTWPSSVKNAAGLTAALTTTASTISQVVFLWNGTFYTWQVVGTGLAP